MQSVCLHCPRPAKSDIPSTHVLVVIITSSAFQSAHAVPVDNVEVLTGGLKFQVNVDVAPMKN